jgi:hypothetical protein
VSVPHRNATAITYPAGLNIPASVQKDKEHHGMRRAHQTSSCKN